MRRVKYVEMVVGFDSARWSSMVCFFGFFVWDEEMKRRRLLLLLLFISKGSGAVFMLLPIFCMMRYKYGEDMNRCGNV